MFPRIHDVFYYLFGVDVRFPGMTFGLFVALAFIAAYQVLRYEFKRREKGGEFRMDKVRKRISGPIPISDVYIQFAIWAIVGYKLGAGILDWDAFSDDPGAFLFSAEGSVVMAIVFGAIGAGLRYRVFAKHKDEEEKFDLVDMGPSRYLGQFLLIAFVAGLTGAKVFDWLEDPMKFWNGIQNDFTGTVMSADGLTFYGGLLTAGFFISRFLYRRRYDLLHVLDIFTAPMIIAYGVGRIGCQMAGDGDWGVANNSPKPDALSFLPDWMWKFRYPHNVLNRDTAMAAADCDSGYCERLCDDGFCSQLGEAVFPTPFYETIMALMIFAALMLLRKRLVYYGQLTGVYFFLNGIERFSIEKIRVNATYPMFGMEVTQAEIISTVMMIVGISIFVYVTFIRKKNPEIKPAPTWLTAKETKEK